MTRIKAMEGESVTFRARPTNEDGATVYLSGIETALVSVFDTSSATKSTPVFEEELVPSDIAFETLQVDLGWRSDKHGYTVKYALPAGILNEGGRVYRIELVLRTFTSGPRPVVFLVETDSLWTARTALGV